MRNQVRKNNRWYLSKHKYLEAYHHALQYNELVREINNFSVVQSPKVDGMPHNISQASPTEKLFEHYHNIESRLLRIRETAFEADKELSKWILLAVTQEKKTYETLNPPCSRGTFYDRLRKFYFLLSRKLNSKV